MSLVIEVRLSLQNENKELVGRPDYEEWENIINYYWIRNKLEI